MSRRLFSDRKEYCKRTSKVKTLRSQHNELFGGNDMQTKVERAMNRSSAPAARTFNRDALGRFAKIMSAFGR